MNPALAEFSERGAGGGPSGSLPPSEGESQTRDEECVRMAAFRIRETANRIATLAERVQEPQLRDALYSIRDRLVSEEQALTGQHRAKGREQRAVRTIGPSNA